MRTPVESFLRKHAAKRPISFHMPGHKGSKLYRSLGYGDFLDRFMDCDITEIQGADNLFQTEGILKEVAAVEGAEDEHEVGHQKGGPELLQDGEHLEGG